MMKCFTMDLTCRCSAARNLPRDLSWRNFKLWAILRIDEMCRYGCLLSASSTNDPRNIFLRATHYEILMRAVLVIAKLVAARCFVFPTNTSQWSLLNIDQIIDARCVVMYNAYRYFPFILSQGFNLTALVALDKAPGSLGYFLRFIARTGSRLMDFVQISLRIDVNLRQ